MIVIEEEHDKEAKRHSNKHPFHLKIPEIDEPVAWLRRVESPCDRDSCQVCILDVSMNM